MLIFFFFFVVFYLFSFSSPCRMYCSEAEPASVVKKNQLQQTATSTLRCCVRRLGLFTKALNFFSTVVWYSRYRCST